MKPYVGSKDKDIVPLEDPTGGRWKEPLESPVHWSVTFGENVRMGFNVVIEKGCHIGNNCFIGHNVVMRPNTVIGDNCLIGHGSVFEGDTLVGSDVTIHAQCHVTQHTFIQNQVFLGPGVILINTYKISHGREYPTSREGPRVEYGCRVGAGAVLMPGITLEREVLIGANSTVTKDCDAFGIYIGSPAKFIKHVPLDERL